MQSSAPRQSKPGQRFGNNFASPPYNSKELLIIDLVVILGGVQVLQEESFRVK